MPELLCCFSARAGQKPFAASIFKWSYCHGAVLVHHYTLFIDEAGDDKVDRLKPDSPNGNSEWLCLGGYLVRAELEPDLDRRRDEILRSFGGQRGGVLHYRNLKPKNRLLAARKLASRDYPARGFVVCSYKKTVSGYHNTRAASAAGNPRDVLFNFVVRLLLERATHYVVNFAAPRHGIRDPVLRIVMASRKGHHFGRFKAYLAQLMYQAVAGTTYLNTRTIRAEVLRWNKIDRAAASQVSGLQLADVLVSAFFQSIERVSPHYDDKVARCLLPLMAEQAARPGVSVSRANEGVTFYPAVKVARLLTAEQSSFFAQFGYDMDKLKGRNAVNHVQALSQAERMWSQCR
ncbi:MAG: DUF3800 domain-containing protein [Gemmobacter sp.]|jgi:hypothetical protein|nr:DUF3800 domain-containing protein [Gemmobacter sp.]